MTKEAKKAAKLEKKLKILTGGYQVCIGYTGVGLSLLCFLNYLLCF